MVRLALFVRYARGASSQQSTKADDQKHGTADVADKLQNLKVGDDRKESLVVRLLPVVDEQRSSSFADSPAIDVEGIFYTLLAQDGAVNTEDQRPQAQYVGWEAVQEASPRDALWLLTPLQESEGDENEDAGSSTRTYSSGYRCTVCSKPYASSLEFVRHMKRKHPGMPRTFRGVFECDICGAGHAQRSGLFRHRVREHPSSRSTF